MFAPPSAEAVWLLDHLPRLVAPAPGDAGWLARFLRMVMVAPMTQMTFLSFDLQLFLYGVFHTTRIARVFHFVFQASVTFWLLVAACSLQWSHPTAHSATWISATAAAPLALLLVVWYGAMALRYRLGLWFALMVLWVGVAYALATRLYHGEFALDPVLRSWYAPLPLALNPWLWMAGSAFLVALSHAPEPKLPPRTVEGVHWLSLRDYLFGRPDLPTSRIERLARVAMFPVWGTIDEWWASPRLVPYGVLMVMFRMGYQPQLWSTHRSWVEAAWHSGNPALDYVGIGGGTPLRRAAWG